MLHRSGLAHLPLPAGTSPEAGPLLIGRALRAFADGFVVILLPAYLLAATKLSPGTRLWTRDRRLGSATARLGIAYELPH